MRRGVKHQSGSGGFDQAMLPDDDKQQLCRSLLAEFGADNLTLRGDEMIHSCVLPFGQHRNGDRNPSASLNWDKLTYNCLGCGNSGGLLWFIGTCRGTSGTEARKWLDDQTGFGADAQDLSSLLEYFDSLYKPKDRPPPLPKMSEAVLKPWMLIHPYMTDPKPEGRGVPERAMREFKVGYGVLRTPIQGKSAPDGKPIFVDSHRIIIPHFWRDNLVGWQSRRIVNDGTPKYVNTPDFPKDQSIYNYLRDAPSAVVVESVLSVLSKIHLAHMEATFSASVTDTQVRQLSMHPSVVLFFDNDDAGWKATHHVAEMLEAYSQVMVAANPYAADPADLDDETYLDCVNSAIPYALWNPPKELIPWR